MKRALFVVSVAWTWSGCQEWVDMGKDWGWLAETGLDTAVDTVATVDGTVCSDPRSLSFSYDDVIAYCGTGMGPGIPPGFRSIVPASVGAYVEYPNDQSVSDEETNTFQVVVSNSTGSPLLNNDPYDGNIWENQWDPPCSDYQFYNNGHNWMIRVGTQALFTDPLGPTCGLTVNAQSFAPPGRVPSGPQSCTAGEALFDLAVRHVLAGPDAGDASAIWVSPLERVTRPFPERAWLRELEVVSWGNANKVQLAEFSKSLGLTEGHFVGGTSIPRPAQGSTVRTFATGTMPMSTLVGIEGTFNDQSSELPVLRMRWSCESNASNPHAVPVTGFTPHVGTLLAGNPVQQRMVFWVASDNTSVRFAPEGRYPDYVNGKLTPAAAGGWAFSLPLESYGAKFTGRLVPFGNTYKVMDGVVVVGTVTTNLPVKTLQRL